MTGINDCSRPLNLTGRAEPVEQEPMQRLPHTGALPLVQAPPAGDARAVAEFRRQVTPSNPCVEDEQNPRERRPVGMTAAPTPPRRLPLRQQRLDQLPQLIRDDPRRRGRRYPSQLDDGCRADSPSPSGTLPVPVKRPNALLVIRVSTTLAPMAASENKALVRRFYEEAWDQGKLDVIDEFAKNYIRHVGTVGRPTATALRPLK